MDGHCYFFFVGLDNQDQPTWYMVHIGDIGDFPIPVRFVGAIDPNDEWRGFSARAEPGAVGPVIHMTRQTAEITTALNLASAYDPLASEFC